jgi:hypothetical protein
MRELRCKTLAKVAKLLNGKVRKITPEIIAYRKQIPFIFVPECILP